MFSYIVFLCWENLNFLFVTKLILLRHHLSILILSLGALNPKSVFGKIINSSMIVIERFKS